MITGADQTNIKIDSGWAHQLLMGNKGLLDARYALRMRFRPGLFGSMTVVFELVSDDAKETVAGSFEANLRSVDDTITLSDLGGLLTINVVT